MTTKRWPLIVALFLGTLLVLTRDWMHAHMARHMLVQMPLLALLGWQLALVSGERFNAQLEPFNRYGLTGFLLVQCVAAFWMVPRAIDLVLSSPPMEAAKVVSWLVAGIGLRQSMLQSSSLIQLFMLGNVAMMFAATSQAYAEAPARLCNAYSLGDQQVVAQGLLIWLGVLTALWLLHVWRSRPFISDEENREASSAS
jgi:hypothetical protein